MWAERFDLSAIKLIKKAKDLGFEGVEIPLMELDVIDVEKTKKELKQYGVTALGSMGLPQNLDISSSDAATRERGIEHMKRSIEIISELGGDCINGVIYTAWGKITGKPRTEEEWKYSVDSLKKICQYAKKYGVTLGIEPVNRFETYFINTASDAVKLAKDVDEPNIKVHLDTFHMNIEEKNFYQPIKDTGSMLWHMHCCENDRSIAGTGHVDWDGVFRALSEINYDRWIVVESFTQDMEKIAASTAIWRKMAPSADALASEGLRFLKKMAEKYELHSK
ncbi:sugar phosphate isomerase/epimerase [Candidatus Bathyarchaeota archaeon]|nr:sugar phosphate isomerase/epimerase [Candidatus Bathyarchaeota archaeon]